MSYANVVRTTFQRLGKSAGVWAFPLGLTAAWLIWPALDQEWLQSVGLASDPQAGIKKVEAAKQARYEALLKSKGIDPSKKDEDTDDESEEEEPEEEEETPEEEEEEEVAPGPADEEEDEESEDDEEESDEDEEEEEGHKVAPLYLPTKGKKLDKKEIWDNFTIKALRMNDEDDDDDEEDEDDEDDDE